VAEDKRTFGDNIIDVDQGEQKGDVADQRYELAMVHQVPRTVPFPVAESILRCFGPYRRHDRLTA
jgi:hypothetical protein